MEQLKLITEQSPPPKRRKISASEYEKFCLTRLSKNFLMRDFMFSTECAARGFTNWPEDTDMVIRAGKALCERVLEPVLEQWGQFAITFGFMSRECLEHGWSMAERAQPRSSCPHQWDRKSWGEEVYARVDILLFCVMDGEVSRYEFARWCMMNLDIDLLMQWTRSNGACITISPKPRRVWLEWGNTKLGEPRQQTFMGTDYWQRVYPYLPEHERPRFAPSETGGRLQWRR